LTRRRRQRPSPRALKVIAVIPDQWIERYRRAWETADADQVVDLFTPDASSSGQDGPASGFLGRGVGRAAVSAAKQTRMVSATGVPGAPSAGVVDGPGKGGAQRTMLARGPHADGDLVGRSHTDAG
jgi:hypothetical protein